METILKITEQPAVDDMVTFIKSLSVKEQQEINIFLQGIKFAKKIAEKEPA